MFYLILLGAYILVGIAALGILEANTHKISRNLGRATQETQKKIETGICTTLAKSGQPVDLGVIDNPHIANISRYVIVAATLAFWPAAIYGYFESRYKNNIRRNKE